MNERSEVRLTDPRSGTAQTARNWWKIAFFVVLVMFEFAREWAVIESSNPSQPNAIARVYSYKGYTVAQGSWRRIDGGGAMMPATVTIQCRPEVGSCIEASAMISDQYVFAPEVDWFTAKFSADAVTYENDDPSCARYLVRIDLRLKKAFAVRTRKPNPPNVECGMLEERIEMQLANGFDPASDPTRGHFLPLFSAIRWITNRL